MGRPRKKRHQKLKYTLIFFGCLFLAAYLFTFRRGPEEFTYGVSFSKFHTDELHLDYKQTLNAILNELKVKHIRYSAHWPLTEPQDGKYNFTELDYQMKEAKIHNADVIIAVGRRLPGWPECHEPDWAKNLSVAVKKKKILDYITAVVNRYKDHPKLKYWQMENEYFLQFYARGPCGTSFGEDFLKEEAALVRKLDAKHPVILTDSGEFGQWYKAYRNGDVFGTSLYLYVWSHFSFIGPYRYPINPWFFRLKRNIIEAIYGRRPVILIELSAEPYLLHPILETSVEVTRQRMGVDKLKEMITFARSAGFETQYLWGAEWWYYEKTNGRSDLWNEAGKLFKQ